MPGDGKRAARRYQGERNTDVKGSNTHYNAVKGTDRDDQTGNFGRLHRGAAGACAGWRHDGTRRGRSGDSDARRYHRRLGQWYIAGRQHPVHRDRKLQAVGQSRGRRLRRLCRSGADIHHRQQHLCGGAKFKPDVGHHRPAHRRGVGHLRRFHPVADRSAERVLRCRDNHRHRRRQHSNGVFRPGHLSAALPIHRVPGGWRHACHHQFRQPRSHRDRDRARTRHPCLARCRAGDHRAVAPPPPPRADAAWADAAWADAA